MSFSSASDIPPLDNALEALRWQATDRGWGVLPFAQAAIDGHLPGGGLPLGQLHEIESDGLDGQTGAISGGFTAWLAARMLGSRAAHERPGCEGVVLWAASCCDLHAPGLTGHGIDPGAMILARCSNDAETLQVMQTALRSGAVCAVVGEVGNLPRQAARRLQLACLSHGSTGLLLRRWPRGRQGALHAVGAATRWRVSAAPSLLEEGPEKLAVLAGTHRWQLDLLHARGGRPGSWIVERSSQQQLGKAGDAYPVHVAAVLGDDASAARAQRRNAA